MSGRELKLYRAALFWGTAVVGVIVFLLLPPVVARWLFFGMLGFSGVLLGQRQWQSITVPTIRLTPWQQQFLVWGMAGLAVGVMVLAGDLFAKAEVGDQRQFALQLAVLSGLIWWGVLYFRRLPLPTVEVEAVNFPVRWRWLICAGMVMALFAFINGNPAYLVSHHLQGLLLLGVLAALIRGSGWRGWQWSAEGWWLMGIIGLGVALRLYRLDSSITLFVDEVSFSNAVRRFWV